jgi:AmmeMemoRadiSam system protein B
MSLVFAAITPHPPILIPSIGKNQMNAIAKTKAAMEQLEQDLYLTKPHIIIVISPHGSLFADAFSINAHTEFSSLFEQFGDLTTKKQWTGIPELAVKISNAGKAQDMPIQLVSQACIDHGTSVPLFYLTNHISDAKVLPIGYSALPPETHMRYGELLKDVIMSDDRRIAVVASGDLSHCLTVNAPHEYHKDGETFDTELMQLLEVRNTAGIVGLGAELVKNSCECGYRSILIALGILKNINYTFKHYSYEAPFGVGYLVGNFVF